MFCNILTPFINHLPVDMIESLRHLTDKHRDTVVAIQEHYNACPTHIEFLQSSMYSMRRFLLENSVEYSQKGLQMATGRIKPLVEGFSQQRERTDRAAQAILFLMMEYIDDSPFSPDMALEKAPMLAVLGVNLFLVTFSTTVVVASGLVSISMYSSTGYPKTGTRPAETPVLEPTPLVI